MSAESDPSPKPRHAPPDTRLIELERSGELEFWLKTPEKRIGSDQVLD